MTVIINYSDLILRMIGTLLIIEKWTVNSRSNSIPLARGARPAMPYESRSFPWPEDLPSTTCCRGIQEAADRYRWDLKKAYKQHGSHRYGAVSPVRNSSLR
jgi:hypothetical protein